MIGVGLIYRWYRRFGRGPLSSPAPDDAVAVHSGPPELGFLPLTDALVDLQRTFSAWSRLGAVSPSERDRLTTFARNMNFRERSLSAVLQAAGWAQERSRELRQQMIGQKRHDAILALQQAPTLLAQHSGTQQDGGWIATNTFLRDLEAGGIDSNLVNTYKLKP